MPTNPHGSGEYAVLSRWGVGAMRRSLWTLFGHRPCAECARLQSDNAFLRALLLVAIDDLEAAADAIQPPRKNVSPQYWGDARLDALWADIQASRRFDVIDGGAA